MKKIALCIPTYNDYNDLNNFLLTDEEILFARNVDLIIFDSSKNDAIKLLIEKWNQDGYTNLIYENVGFINSSNGKILYILKNVLNYEYVWVTHDHTIFKAEVLDFILNSLGSNPDFIYLKMHCAEFGVSLNEDLNAFFVDSVWQLCRFGAAIVKTKTFSMTLDEQYIYDRYFDEKRIAFSHIGLYFETLYKMENPRIATFMFPREFFYDTKRFERLSWEKDVFRICLECWGMVLTELPKFYDIETALKTIDKDFFSKYKIFSYKKEGLYSEEIFEKYKKWIRLIAPERYKELKELAYYSYEEINEHYIQPIHDKFAEIRNHNHKVAIFGAGRHGYEYIQMANHIGERIDAVLVTDTKYNPIRVENVPVYKASDYLKENDATVIITVAEKDQPEIIRCLESLKHKELQIYLF